MKSLIYVAALSLVGMTAIANQETPELNTNDNLIIVADDFKEIKVSELPEAVATAVNEDYAGATVSKAYKNDKDQYKLELAMEDGTAGTVYADAEGNWIEK